MTKFTLEKLQDKPQPSDRSCHPCEGNVTVTCFLLGHSEMPGTVSVVSLPKHITWIYSWGTFNKPKLKNLAEFFRNIMVLKDKTERLFWMKGVKDMTTKCTVYRVEYYILLVQEKSYLWDSWQNQNKVCSSTHITVLYACDLPHVDICTERGRSCGKETQKVLPVPGISLLFQ